jgi:hypothetical protein
MSTLADPSGEARRGFRDGVGGSDAERVEAFLAGEVGE